MLKKVTSALEKHKAIREHHWVQQRSKPPIIVIQEFSFPARVILH